MKITLHWLREFTPVTAAAKELSDQLTLGGLEVESVEPVAPPFSGVVVGDVLTAARHPNAERLSVCEVTTNGSDRLQIVCGAPNVRSGLKVAVALAGAQLPGGVSIKRTKLRGVESNGMLCSARELGLGEEHDGILELPDTVALGADLRAALDLDDVALEVKATPNRGDCMSVLGIARDYSAIRHGSYLKFSVAPVPATHADRFPVVVETPAACPVFACRLIRGVKAPTRSPAWLRERLRRVGLNSISPIVDVTNYVMAELGQPLHAYDRARLSAGITVRTAKPDERIALLDGKEYRLDPDFLVIADAAGPVGLAGIMGGRDSAIGSDTMEVLLEAAHFTPDAIAGRARRVGLFTDAAQRFERGVDATLPTLALERATSLLLQIAGGEPGPIQCTTAAEGVVTTAEWIGLRRSRLTRLLGVSIPDDEVLALLSAVTGEAHATDDGWRVRPPAHRFDLRIEADLIEEVARLRGLDRIPELPASAPQIAGRATESRVGTDRLMTAMADAGYREVITYSFVDPQLQRLLFPESPVLTLANALSADMSEMRVSLWTGLVHAARENLRRQQSRVRLFEIGNKFELVGSTLKEIETLAGLTTGARWPEQWGSERVMGDFYDLKADLERLFMLTGDAGSYRFAAASLGCLRPGRTAQILRRDIPVGWVGEVHPRLVKALGISEGSLLFELDVELAFAAKITQVIRISKFPSVRRDIAVVVDESVPLAVLRENVTVSASGLLSDLKVFDIYRGPNVEVGRKSVALGLILQDSSRTLTDDDADAVVASVVARLRDVLSASIRDK